MVEDSDENARPNIVAIDMGIGESQTCFCVLSTKDQSIKGIGLQAVLELLEVPEEQFVSLMDLEKLNGSLPHDVSLEALKYKNEFEDYVKASGKKNKRRGIEHPRFYFQNEFIMSKQKRK